MRQRLDFYEVHAQSLGRPRHQQVGFAIRVEGGRLTADLEDVFPDFEVAFEGAEDGSTFYRSDRTRALGDEFGDMLHKILDLEARATPLRPTPCSWLAA